MWANSYGMEYRNQNSPRANGSNRTNNPHFDEKGKPSSEKAKAVQASIQKVSNSSAKKNGYTRLD